MQQLAKNVAQLQAQLKDEFAAFENEIKQGSAANDDLKLLGFNGDMFEHALAQFAETQAQLKGFLEAQVEELFNQQASREALAQLTATIQELDFNIDGAQYAEYDQKDFFITE